MANEIRYQVGFDVKQADLNKLKASLQDIQKLKISDVMKINNTDAASATTMLNNIRTQAQNVEGALKNAFNTKLNTINIQTFNKSLKASTTSIQQVYKTFKTAGTAGENAFRSLSAQVLSTNIQLKENHNILDKISKTLTNTVKWNLASGAINTVSRSIEQAWGYTKSLDTSLNNIRIVTGKSAEEMGNFAIKANEAAQSLGKTTTDYTNAALIYAQQGLSDKEIEERARITLMTANVTGQSASDVSEELTAVWNGYKVNAEEAELYIDRLAAIAATTASDLEELSTGMSKVASAAAAMGVGEDQLAAQLSTIISVTRQAPESVGTALRTVYARISDIKAGIDEDGVTLGNYSGKMAELGFNVLDAAGKLRDMGEVMEDIGNRWQDLTREQQISLAQTMAGQRQYSNLIALFDNFEKYNEALETARNATGTLQEQQDIYMQGVAAHLQTLKAAIENIYDSLADTDSINSIADGLTVAANVTANLVDSLGGGVGVLKALGSIGVTVFSEQIARGINTTITNFEIAEDNARQFEQALQATKDWQGIPELDNTTKKLLENKEQLLELARLMTPEQFSGMQALLNNITELGNEIAKLEAKKKSLTDLLNKDFDIDIPLQNFLGSAQADEVEKIIKEQTEGFQEISQRAEEVGRSVEKNFSKFQVAGEKGTKATKQLKKALNEAASETQTYMNSLKDMQEKGFFIGTPEIEKQIGNLGEQWQKVLQKINSKKFEPEAAEQSFKNFLKRLVDFTSAAGDKIDKRYKDLLQAMSDPDFINKLQQKQRKLEQQMNAFVTGQERMQRAAKIESWAKVAGGIAQVGSAIQQIQNLGSIWKNSDLSGGQKLLQTITNLAFSLPMLASGFTKATTAIGLMRVATKAEQIAAIKATTTEIAHAGALSVVETASGAAAIKVQLLNTTLLMNPFAAVAVAVIALATAFGTLINAADEANKSQQEFYNTEIEKSNKTQEQIEKNKELYAAIDELNKKYEDGEITRNELKSSIDDLITKYGLEKQAADKLTNSYKNLNGSIREVRLQAAKKAEESAIKERSDAEQNIFKTAKSKAFDSGRQVADKYVLSLSQGFFGGDEPEELRDALKRIGGQGGGGAITFDTNFDLKSLLTLYDNIDRVITNIEPLLTSEEMQASNLYQNTTKWLKQMQPKIEAYRDALKDVAKYQKDRIALQAETNNKINFQNIQSSNDYIQQRKALIEEYKRVLEENGDTQSDSAAMADAYLSEYYSELYKKFNEVANYIDEVREKFGRPNKFIEAALQQLDEQHFSALMDLIALHPSVVHDWESLGKAIHYISEQDFSNINNLPQIQGNAADQYNIYHSLEDQVSSGKTINAKELERLTPEVQEFFSMMANGSYKMTGNAKEFYETVNSLKLDGFKTALAQINSQINKTENLQNQNFNYKELDKQAYKGAPFADYGGIDYDLVQKQLDYLQVVSSGNAEMQVAIDLWQDQIDKQKQSKEVSEETKQTINEIASAIANASDQTNNLKEKAEQLKQNASELEQQLHDAMFPTDADVDTGTLESLSETIQNVAVKSKELADSLQEDARTSEDVAESILRFDNAIEDIVKNYDNWMDALKSDTMQDQAEIINDLRDAYADLLDLDGSSLSKEFLTSTENLDLMKAAIDGDIEAYNQLLELSGQDIAMSVGLDSSQFFTDRDTVWNAAAELVGTDFGDIEIGAQLNDEGFRNGLENIVNQAGMTARQATDYLSSMGVDAEVIEQKTQGTETKTETGWNVDLVPHTEYGTAPTLSGLGGLATVTPMSLPYTVYSTLYTPASTETEDIKENSAFSLKVTSAHKSSGGKFKFSQSKNGAGSGGSARRNGGSKKGGGGGGGKTQQPSKSKAIKPDREAKYHDVNKTISKLNKEYDDLQKKREKTYGKQLQDVLKDELKILEKQIEAEKEKQEIIKKEQEELKKVLELQGAIFDPETNEITNYEDLILKIEEKRKQLNQKHDAMTKDQQDAFKEQYQKEKERLEELTQLVQRYVTLQDRFTDSLEQQEEYAYKQIQKKIEDFRIEIEVSLDMGQAERKWNEFERNVLNHSDILKESNFDKMFKDIEQGYADVLSYFDVNGQGSIEALTNQLLATQEELDEINSGGESSIYGTDKKRAMEDLQNDLDELMQQMQDIESLIDNIDQAYLDTIDDISEQFDKQIDNYGLIGDLIEHDIDLLSLLYGDKNYEAMDKYYTTLHNNNLKQLDSLKRQRDFWKEQWDAAVAREDSEAAKQFEEHYKETIGNLNSLIEESTENLRNKYINAIDSIFDDLDKKISGGLGTNYLETSWDLMKKNADEYLDTINSAFAVQDLENKFQKAINDTKVLKNQQALKKLMDQQLNNLKAKEKLTEYDVQRAEKLLQIEQARIALEDAQASKTSMRLKRDAQGNYSYEYVADESNISEAEQGLATAQNDLYNFDKDRYNSNLEDILGAWKDFQEQYKDIMTDSSLSEDQRVANSALLREQYGQYINDKTAENLVIRNNLRESAFADIAALYRTDVDNYKQMSTDEQNILMNELVPTWESGIQQMTDRVAGQGGFIPVCQDAFEDINQATLDYQNQLDEMANVAGIDLQNVKGGVDDLAISFDKLVIKNDDLITTMGKELSAVEQLKNAAHALMEEYNGVYDAAKDAVSVIHEAMQESRSDIFDDRDYNDDDDETYTEQFTGKKYPTVFDFQKLKESGQSNSNQNTILDDTPGYVSEDYLKGKTLYTHPFAEEDEIKQIEDFSSEWFDELERQGHIVTGTKKYTTDDGQTVNIPDNIWNLVPGGDSSDIEDILDWEKLFARLDTGGYTGDWSGNGGKLAVLHKKELVLNADDTENLFNTMNLLKSITDSLNGDLFARTSGIKSGTYNNLGDSEELEQNVHIDASFPNVNSKREIEEALSDLVNLAAQRAMRR